MMDALLLLMGFLVSFIGLAGGILTYAFGRISNLASLLFEKNINPSPETFWGFVLLFLSGFFIILFVSIRSPERRYRFLCTFSLISSALSSFLFLYETVFLGPGWLGVELLGEASSPFVKISLSITGVSILTFLTTLSRLVVEVSE